MSNIDKAGLTGTISSNVFGKCISSKNIVDALSQRLFTGLKLIFIQISHKKTQNVNVIVKHDAI